MSLLAVFVEEASAKVMLDELLPRILPEKIEVKVFAFEGKSDLDKNLSFRLRHWVMPDTRFLVLLDQDLSDCHEVKRILRQKCVASGKPDALVRVVCRCLECWYFGDLAAVEQALALTGLQKYERKAKYRVADAIQSADRELDKITKSAYQKVSSSREIGKYLDPDGNRSVSFTHFISGIRRLTWEGD